VARDMNNKPTIEWWVVDFAEHGKILLPATSENNARHEARSYLLKRTKVWLPCEIQFGDPTG
jgi:hypothetical protein